LGSTIREECWLFHEGMISLGFSYFTAATTNGGYTQEDEPRRGHLLVMISDGGILCIGSHLLILRLNPSYSICLFMMFPYSTVISKTDSPCLTQLHVHNVSRLVPPTIGNCGKGPTQCTSDLVSATKSCRSSGVSSNGSPAAGVGSDARHHFVSNQRIHSKVRALSVWIIVKSGFGLSPRHKVGLQVPQKERFSGMTTECGVEGESLSGPAMVVIWMDLLHLSLRLSWTVSILLCHCGVLTWSRLF
jgi:hypothetical protein